MTSAAGACPRQTCSQQQIKFQEMSSYFPFSHTAPQENVRTSLHDMTMCRSRLTASLPQALQEALTEHQGEVDYLTSAVEQVFLKAPADISQK